MPRDAAAYLIEMDEACGFLITRTASMSLTDYLDDKTIRFAVERCFITIGEAVNQLHKHHPAIGSVFVERPGMIAFRNFIVHQYWAIDDEDVWSTLISKVPSLKTEIELTLRNLSES